MPFIKKFYTDDVDGYSMIATVSDTEDYNYDIKLSDCTRKIRISGNHKSLKLLEDIRDDIDRVITKVKLNSEL